MKYRKELTSSCLAEARYDTVTKTLTLVMARNDSEVLYTCPKSVFDRLCYIQETGGSIGEEYNFNIRGNYPYVDPKSSKT